MDLAIVLVGSSLLLGALIGLRFKVYALLAALLTIAIVVPTLCWTMHSGALSMALISLSAVVACQLAYFGVSFLRGRG